MLIQIFKKAVHITLLIFVLKSYAQEPVKSSCSQKLKEMQKSYEQGVLAFIPDELDQCMSNGFTKTERLQGYRLIILTYLFLDETEKAEKKMNELLVYEPDYQPNKALDPVEYIMLFESFRVEPQISFGILLGVNQTRPRLINDFSVGSSSNTPTKYNTGINFDFGASIDYLVYRKLVLTTDVFLMLQEYKLTSQVLKTSILSSTESDMNILVPITLKYSFGTKKVKFFVRGGLAANLLVSAQSQLIRKNEETSQNDFAGPNLDLKYHRNSLDFAGVLGAGVTYKLGYGFITLDARYYLGLSNITKKSERYTNFANEISNYGYIENDVALDNLQVSIGYMYSLFKVRKVKAKTQ